MVTTIVAQGEHLGGTPFRASWLDAVLDAIARVPFWPWAFYGGYAAFVLVYLHAEAWIAGKTPFGAYDPSLIAPAFYEVYPLGLVDALRRIAARSWRAFRPAIELAEAEAGRREYELTHTPARAGIVVGLVAAVIVAVSLMDPVAVALSGVSGLALAMGLAAVWVTVATVLMLVTSIVRMMGFVSRALDEARHVDLFKPEPLYAFSRLTLRAGLGLIFIAVVQLVLVPADQNAQPQSVAWLTMLVAAGAAAFVLPLQGMHDRIVAERRRLQGEASDRLEATIARLHAAVDADDRTSDDTLNKRLGSLIQERDLLLRLPTWPWEPGTGRAFASAILLPVVVWLLTRLLGRVF